MDGKNEELNFQTGEEKALPTSCDDSDQPEALTRRTLIERYGKYAVVAPPLLLFVSRAMGQDDPDIHSKP